MMRRQDREQNEAFALALLRDCEYATLATVNADGTPYCVPLSPVLHGRSLYFHGAAEGQKWQNLSARPAVCVSAVGRTRLLPADFSTAYESVVATGRCELVSDDGEKRLALRLLCEKYAPDYPAEAERAIDRSLASTAIGKITLDSVTGKANCGKDSQE